MTPKRKLPLLCASNEGGDDENGEPLGFHTEPCTGKSCHWFQNGSCSAGTQQADDYRQWFKPDDQIPPCPIAERCMWNVEALARGEPACGVRRLGLICEHQGGIWNTWEMAPATDAEAWGDLSLYLCASLSVMQFSRLREWITRFFADRRTPRMSDALVIREYVLTGWDFATAVSRVTVSEKRNKDTLLLAWEIAEKRYSDRGFRTVPLDDFVRYASLGSPLRGIGAKRDPDEIVILHAPYYRLYEWKKPNRHHDMTSMLVDEGYIDQDFTRAYARQVKRTS